MESSYLSTTVKTVTTNNSNGSNIVSGCSVGVISSLENHVYAVFMVLVLIATLFGNGIVIFVVGFSQRLKERPTFYFIASLGKLIHVIQILDPSRAEM